MERPGLDAVTLSFFKDLQSYEARLFKSEKPSLERIATVCGLDVAYRGEKATVAAIVQKVKGNRTTEKIVETRVASFPYIPGLLYLREGPLMVHAARILKGTVDLFLVDGHGIAHPRRAGLACYVGLLLDRPTVGIAKSLFAGNLGRYVNDIASISIDGEMVGYSVRSSLRKPFYVSPGFKVRLIEIPHIIKSFKWDYPSALQESHRIAKEAARHEQNQAKSHPYDARTSNGRS